MDEITETATAWVKDRVGLWFTTTGTYQAKEHPMLTEQRVNMKGQFFHPDAFISLGPAPVNPDEEAFRLYITSEAMWRGPFTHFATASAAFVDSQQETSHEDRN